MLPCVDHSSSREFYSTRTVIGQLANQTSNQTMDQTSNQITNKQNNVVIEPLSLESINMCKDMNFKVDYKFAKTPGITMCVTFKVETEEKASQYSNAIIRCDSDDYDYVHDCRPQFVRQFFFPYMIVVPENFLDLLVDKIRPLMNTNFGDVEIMRQTNCLGDILSQTVTIIDIKTTDANNKDVSQPNTPYYMRSSPQWCDHWERERETDDNVKFFQYKFTQSSRHLY